MVRHLQVRLEPSEKEAFEKKAKECGYESEQKAAHAILTQWSGGIEGGALGRLTAEEERLLRGLLAFVRDPANNPYMIDMLRKIAKDWLKKG